MSESTISIGILPENGYLDIAKRLAAQLQLPILENAADADMQLVVSVQGLDLRIAGFEEKKPLQINFLEPHYSKRLQRATHKNELIAKAVGLKNHPLNLVDATAGLGQDGYLLAHLGATVTMLERNPVVHSLLADGLARAESDISLINADAADWLASNPNQPVDVIYLDPMFPARQKSALVKKPMQRFHQLLGNQTGDAKQLFTAALNYGAKRVVVKRPPSSGHLNNMEPHHSHTGKAARFDVYMP